MNGNDHAEGRTRLRAPGVRGSSWEFVGKGAAELRHVRPTKDESLK